MSCNKKVSRAMVIGLDGADPLFMKTLLAEGKLPNVKKLLEMGTTTPDMGMIGALPTVTPPNWASLATGAWPNTHGITCFWNHTLGNPLEQLDYGFSSDQCKSEFIWDAYAQAGKKSIVFNYPTSWPPTSQENVIYVDGSKVIPLMDSVADFEKIYMCEEGDFPIEVIPHHVDQTGADCLVEGEVKNRKSEVDAGNSERNGGDANLEMKKPGVSTDDSGRQENHKPKCDRIYSPIKPANGWASTPAGSKEVVLPVNTGLTRRMGLLISEDGKIFTKLQIFKSKQDAAPIGEVSVGEWSDFIYDNFKINDNSINVAYKVKLISLEADGSKLKLYYNFASNLNAINRFYPTAIGAELFEKIGPQLMISNASKYNPEGDQVVLDSIDGMYDWGAKALNYLMDTREWELTYCHMHAIDLINHWYINHLHEDPRYREIMVKAYEITDKFVGEMMKQLDGNTVMFVTSDHAAIPKGTDCNVPSLGDAQGLAAGVLRELGYCNLKEVNGVMEVDWENTKAISQRLTNIYINLKGREPHGSVDPEEYHELVDQIISDLYNYRDPKTGKRIVSFALKQDEMELVNLDGEHSGDIFFQLLPEFNREHGNGLSNACREGFSLRCLFIAAGAGIKKGEIIQRRVRIVDIVPTISHMQGNPVPGDTEGSIIYQAME